MWVGGRRLFGRVVHVLRWQGGGTPANRAVTGWSSGGGGIRTLGRPCGRQRFSSPFRSNRKPSPRAKLQARGNVRGNETWSLPSQPSGGPCWLPLASIDPVPVAIRRWRSERTVRPTRSLPVKRHSRTLAQPEVRTPDPARLVDTGDLCERQEWPRGASTDGQRRHRGGIA